jgi:hypothetical protein
MSSYSLEALVAHPDVLAHLPEPLASMGQVPLSTSLALVPVPLDMLGHLYSDEPVLDAVRDMLGPLVEEASRFGPLAYLHAEMYDDEGSQGALVWREGAVVYESFEDPVGGAGPIDRGLAEMGVVASPDHDAFDVLGLDRHHTLEGWISDAGVREG